MPEQTVFIVDDDDALIDSLTMRYQDDYKVLSALNVADAKAILATDGATIDVAILDLTMPMSSYSWELNSTAGMEVFRAARGGSGLPGLAPSTQFVALTANNKVDHKEFTLLGIGIVIKGTPGFLDSLDEWIKRACETRADNVGPSASHPSDQNALPVSDFAIREALVKIRDIVNSVLQ